VTHQVEVLVGTKKGAFILDSDRTRQQWRVRGPFCETWPIHHFVRAVDGTLYAGGGSNWYGATVFRSDDNGVTWSQSSAGLTYGDDGPKITHIWNVTSSTDGKTVYAGVEPAGLFRSDDRGETWSHVAGLREHPSQPEWQPGNGGLILHSIALDPGNPDHMWVGISSVGTFETSDGGATWATRNQGVRVDFYPGPPPDFGQSNRTTAASTDPTTRARPGRRSPPTCRPTLASRWQFIHRRRTRCGSSRTAARVRDDT